MNELRKPSSENPEILRFFKYMKAAKDGQDNQVCEMVFSGCVSPRSPDDSVPMMTTFNEINKLVQARHAKKTEGSPLIDNDTAINNEMLELISKRESEINSESAIESESINKPELVANLESTTPLKLDANSVLTTLSESDATKSELSTKSESETKSELDSGSESEPKFESATESKSNTKSISTTK